MPQSKSCRSHKSKSPKNKGGPHKSHVHKNKNNSYQKRQNSNALKGGWVQRVSLSSVSIYPKSWYINDSIWCASKDGMIEYKCVSDLILPSIPYPHWFDGRLKLSLCRHDKDIYIVNGEMGQMVVFDTKRKRYGRNIRLPYLGWGASCIQFQDKIHIFNGVNNHDHIIYDINTEAITKSGDYYKENRITSQRIGLYQTKFIRFSGLKHNELRQREYYSIDKILMTTHDHKLFTVKSSLPLGISAFGWVIWRQYLFIFGGWILYQSQYKDEIYFIDLNNIEKNKWNKLEHTKCPLKSHYEAVISGRDKVHLFSTQNERSIAKHYEIPIKFLLGDLYYENENDHKCGECDRLKTKRRTLERLLKDQGNFKQTNVDKKKIIDNLIMENTELTEYLLNQQEEKEHDEYSLIEHLDMFNNKLSSFIVQNIESLCIDKEFEKLEFSVDKTIDKLKEIKNLIISIKKPDITKYQQWNIKQLINWIGLLENGRYLKYCEVLRKGFQSDEITASTVPSLNPVDLRNIPFNITSFKDRNDLVIHFKLLSQQNEIVSENVEGIITEYH